MPSPVPRQIAGCRPAFCPLCGAALQVVRDLPLRDWYEIWCHDCERTSVVAPNEMQKLPSTS